MVEYSRDEVHVHVVVVVDVVVVGRGLVKWSSIAVMRCIFMWLLLLMLLL